MQITLPTCLILTLLMAAPAWAATTSCPIAGDSDVISRLSWVDAGKTMRSGAVIVDHDHVAGDAPTDRPAVLAAYGMLRTKYHVGAVVNLRAESQEDEAAAKAKGMKYLHLPIADGDAPTPTQVVTFFTFLKDARTHKLVALWHCAGGIGRTGVLAGMLRLREGWSAKAAADEMFKMGLTYDQAIYDLPALNNFANALGKPAYFPEDWKGPRHAPFDYKAIIHKLPAI